jgi:hypothetical protein
MACTKRPTALEVSLDTKNQTPEKIHAAIDALLKANGAIECGLLAFLSMRLGEGSEQKGGSAPSPELAKAGVTSLKTTTD